jgi:hypothetical protein
VQRRGRIAPGTKQLVIRLHVEDGLSPLVCGRLAGVSEQSAARILNQAGVRRRMKGGTKLRLVAGGGQR